jgi:hypothetical protein
LRYRRTSRGCRMVRSHAAAGVAITRNELPHAAAEATEAATAAPRRLAGTPTHGYEPTREAAMAAFATSWRRERLKRQEVPRPRSPQDWPAPGSEDTELGV